MRPYDLPGNLREGGSQSTWGSIPFPVTNQELATVEESMEQFQNGAPSYQQEILYFPGRHLGTQQRYESDDWTNFSNGMYAAVVPVPMDVDNIIQDFIYPIGLRYEPSRQRPSSGLTTRNDRPPNEVPGCSSSVIDNGQLSNLNRSGGEPLSEPNSNQDLQNGGLNGSADSNFSSNPAVPSCEAVVIQEEVGMREREASDTQNGSLDPCPPNLEEYHVTASTSSGALDVSEKDVGTKANVEESASSSSPLDLPNGLASSSGQSSTTPKSAALAVALKRKLKQRWITDYFSSANSTTSASTSSTTDNCPAPAPQSQLASNGTFDFVKVKEEKLPTTDTDPVTVTPASASQSGSRPAHAAVANSQRCICGKKFLNKKRLLCHLYRATPAGWRFRCVECDQPFPFHHQLRMHNVKEHNKIPQYGKKSYHCYKCDVLFPSKSKYWEHIRVHKSGRVKVNSSGFFSED